MNKLTKMDKSSDEIHRMSLKCLGVLSEKYSGYSVLLDVLG